jgi:hypothetical protein
MQVAEGKIKIDNSGVIPYVLKSKSFFGPNYESWFSALLAATLAASDSDSYSFLLKSYTAMLAGLADILTVGWDAWQNDEPGKPQTLTHNPLAGDPMSMFSIIFLQGALKFLKKSAEQHNQLLSTAGKAAIPWETGFYNVKVNWKPAAYGVVKSRTQTFLEILATPSVLHREMDRLFGHSSEPAIPAATVKNMSPQPSKPAPSGPAFSAAELSELSRHYAGMETESLRLLLAETGDLRPGAEQVLRQELEKRGSETD